MFCKLWQYFTCKSFTIQNYFVSQHSRYFLYITNFKTNIRHVCTYLDPYLVGFINIVTKFQNVDIFFTFVKFLNLSSGLLTPAAWKVLRNWGGECIREDKASESDYVQCWITQLKCNYWLQNLQNHRLSIKALRPNKKNRFVSNDKVVVVDKLNCWIGCDYLIQNQDNNES